MKAKHIKTWELAWNLTIDEYEGGFVQITETDTGNAIVLSLSQIRQLLNGKKDE
jgi:hypothetical protein